MLTLSEIKILMTIISEWQDRAPMKVFVMRAGGDLQSALTKLQNMADANQHSSAEMRETREPEHAYPHPTP